MKTNITADLCIIGAGSGGLSVAAGAAQLGLKTVLIERAEMGGDCLNTGCVPSKAFIAAANRAHTHRKSDINGITDHEPHINFSNVKDHVFETIKTIEPHDSQERFESLGVTVLRETARFIDKTTVQAGAQTIKARYIIIATGSHAAIPPITGLQEDKVLTNETIFDLKKKPEHLIIIGGGPIGIEMAQAHRRLGCKVSILDMASILPRDDQNNVEILRNSLREEDIKLYENTSIQMIEHGEHHHHVTIIHNGHTEIIKGSHILVAAGRKPNIDKLELEKAEIAYAPHGITVDTRLRTNIKNIYAIGDVCGGPQFTHVAGYHAGIIIRQICFRMPAKTDYKALPWVTYSDPELAQVGLTEEAARKQYGDTIKVVEWSFHENDRAIAGRTTNGQLRVTTTKRGRILGASMVGPNAGELINIWTLAISSNLKIGAITGMIAPYPTLGEINKRAAGAWYTPSLFSDKTRKIVKWLQKLPF